MIEMFKAAGLQVWMRKPNDEYAYLTDGTHIAYVQWGWDSGISTVHIPNRQTGTGFRFSDTITVEKAHEAMNAVAPYWASNADRASVHKYKDWNAFHKSDSFNSQLVQM